MEGLYHNSGLSGGSWKGIREVFRSLAIWELSQTILKEGGHQSKPSGGG